MTFTYSTASVLSSVLGSGEQVFASSHLAKLRPFSARDSPDGRLSLDGIGREKVKWVGFSQYAEQVGSVSRFISISRRRKGRCTKILVQYFGHAARQKKILHVHRGTVKNCVFKLINTPSRTLGDRRLISHQEPAKTVLPRAPLNSTRINTTIFYRRSRIRPETRKYGCPALGTPRSLLLVVVYKFWFLKKKKKFNTCSNVMWNDHKL